MSSHAESSNPWGPATWGPATWGAAALGTAAYYLHTYPLRRWIVDDAGISFAYARSLAEGHGLVAQPGVEPVEGFTNLLWVLLSALPMRLGGFDLIATPKFAGGLFVFLSLAGIVALLRESVPRASWLGAASVLVTAAAPGFATWCCSGLENSLYGLAVVSLALLASRWIADARPSSKRILWMGVTAFLVSCVRPDGVLYAWIPAFLLGFALERGQRARPLRMYVGSYLAPWAALTVFRATYFHDVLPNTFYAKSAEGSAQVTWLLRELPLPMATLVFIAIGVILTVALASAAVAVGAGARAWVQRNEVAGSERATERLRRIALVGLPAAFFATACIVYAVLRGDWMPEYRFATPAFLFGPAAALCLLGATLGRRRVVGSVLVAVVWGVGFAATCVYARSFSERFIASPTISLHAVEGLSHRIAEEIDPLGPGATVLLPDIGGALWADRFVVFDLLGLIDRDLGRRDNRRSKAQRELILERRPPEAVYLHTHYFEKTGFRRDETFLSRYESRWPEQEPHAALYVRRDAERGILR